MSIVRTKPWAEIVRELERQKSPYLPLAQFIANSDYSAAIFGGVFLSGFLLSDSPEFQLGVHMLRITGSTGRFVFSYERGPGGSKDDTTKEVAESDSVETLDLFLKVKYGVNLRLQKPVA